MAVDYDATIGVDYVSFNMTLEGKKIELQIVCFLKELFLKHEFRFNMNS